MVYGSPKLNGVFKWSAAACQTCLMLRCAVCTAAVVFNCMDRRFQADVRWNELVLLASAQVAQMGLVSWFIQRLKALASSALHSSLSFCNRSRMQLEAAYVFSHKCVSLGGARNRPAASAHGRMPVKLLRLLIRMPQGNSLWRSTRWLRQLWTAPKGRPRSRWRNISPAHLSGSLGAAGEQGRMSSHLLTITCLYCVLFYCYTFDTGKWSVFFFSL